MPTPLGHSNTLATIWEDFRRFAYNIHSEGLAWRWFHDRIHEMTLIVTQHHNPIALVLISGSIASYSNHPRQRRDWLRKTYGRPNRMRPKRRPARTFQGRLHRLKQAGILTQPD